MNKTDNISLECTEQANRKKLLEELGITLEESTRLIESYQRKDKKLKFIHITKTAGTTIEDIGFKHNILWGRHDKEYSSNGSWHRTNLCRDVGFRKRIQYMMTHDFFLVCRDPYERIISEFHCKWGGVGKNINKYDKAKMNQYIQDKIKNRHNFPREPWHYTEQYKYIPTKLVCKTHIIHFENLEKEFNDLMFKYNLPIKLNEKANCSIKKFTVNDLSKETIKLINNVYHKDFIIFNYKVKKLDKSKDSENNDSEDISTASMKTDKIEAKKEVKE